MKSLPPEVARAVFADVVADCLLRRGVNTDCAVVHMVNGVTVYLSKKKRHQNRERFDASTIVLHPFTTQWRFREIEVKTFRLFFFTQQKRKRNTWKLVRDTRCLTKMIWARPKKGNLLNSVVYCSPFGAGGDVSHRRAPGCSTVWTRPQRTLAVVNGGNM